MPLAIEDYAMIGDCHTAALVGLDGSIDWLCLPRFDSASTFGALLGDEDQGRWMLAPSDEQATATRRYRDSTLVLETEWTTPTGTVTVTDFMPIGNRRGDIVRRVHGARGTVTMRQDLRIRFDYARAIPWMRQVGSGSAHALVAVAGPDAIILRGPDLHPSDQTHQGEFVVTENQDVDLTLTWYPSHREWPDPIDVDRALDTTTAWWRSWAGTLTHEGPHRVEVLRSLMLLRALTHEDTGGIVAAATTSLPEQAGGVRTGTTDTSGCATRRSPSAPCSLTARRLRRPGGGNGCCARSPATPATCRSCTASPASATSPSAPCRACRATEAPRLSGSATVP